jgi:hypothetical protein
MSSRTDVFPVIFCSLFTPLEFPAHAPMVSQVYSLVSMCCHFVIQVLFDIHLFFQDATPHMKKGSSVILISSIGGYHPHSSMAMYGVTKTALFGLTKVSSSCVLVPFLFHQELDKFNLLK